MTNDHIARIIERLEPVDRDTLERHLDDIAWSPQTAWAPEHCPITGLKLFMWIEHPTEGMVPTYGGPFDSYTIPVKDSDGSYCRQRYDHDMGGWLIDEREDVGVLVVSDQLWVSDGEDPAELLAERNEHLDHLKQICEIVGEVENGKHDIGVAWESVAAIKHQRDELAAHSDRLLGLLREHYYDFEHSDGLTDWDEEDWHGRVGFALEDKASHSLAELRISAVKGFADEVWQQMMRHYRTIKVFPLTLAKEYAERTRKEAQ